MHYASKKHLAHEFLDNFRQRFNEETYRHFVEVLLDAHEGREDRETVVRLARDLLQYRHPDLWALFRTFLPREKVFSDTESSD